MQSFDKFSTTLDFLMDLNAFLKEQEELGIKFSYTYRGDQDEDRAWVDLEVWVDDEWDGDVVSLFDLEKSDPTEEN